MMTKKAMLSSKAYRALKPEAAQNLGLALHQLATNAEKFGAPSVPDGRVFIAWRQREGPDGSAVELEWHGQTGPQGENKAQAGVR